MLCADPDEQLPVWLKSDAAKPKESRPTFLIHALTQRELVKAAALMKEAQEKGIGNEEATARLDKVIAAGLVGWKNIVFRGQPVPYSPETRVGDFLGAGETWELADLVLDGQALTEGDLGNSSAPSTTAADGSVPSAEPKAGV